MQILNLSNYQIADAFDKAIEIFNEKTDKKKTDTEVPEEAFVTEISFTSPSTTTTDSATTTTTVSAVDSTTTTEVSTSTRFTEELIENSLPLKIKTPKV